MRGGDVFFWVAMMAFAAVVVLLAYVLFRDSTASVIELKSDQWHCTRRASETYMAPMPTGKTVMLIPAQRVVCVKWERL